LPAAVDGQLVKKLAIIVFDQEIIPIILPLELKKLPDLPLVLNINMLSIIKLAEQAEEPFELILLAEINIQIVKSDKHTEELPHDVAEHGDADQEEECAN
jgi:polyphosphate kinase